MRNPYVHVVVEELLLLDLRHLLISSISIPIVLEAHKRGVINALHVAIVHELVLLHDMLGSRIVNGQHLGRLFYSHALGLNDVDQILPLFVINLHVISFSSKEVLFVVLLIFILVMRLIIKAIHKLTLTTIVTFILH